MTQPGIRAWVIIPIICNAVVFLGVSIWSLAIFDGWMDSWLGWVPSWLDFIVDVIWFFLAGLWLFIYGFIYVVLGNLIAAPFNGLLSEQVEAHLTGQPAPEFRWLHLPKIIIRTVGREIRKLCYFLPRAIGIMLLCLILSFIPLVNFLAPFISFIWGSWWLAIQYIDYPLDNKGIPFATLRQQLKTQPARAYGFGSVALLATMVPFINIFAMPIAVIAGTALWVEKLEPRDLAR